MASTPIRLVPNNLSDESIQLSYRLFSAENFFIKAMQYHVASLEPGFDPKTTSVLKDLNGPSRKAIQRLAAILPILLKPETFKPPTDWPEILGCFYPPMHSTLEQIKTLEAEIIALSDIRKPKRKPGQKLTQKSHAEQIEQENIFLKLAEKLDAKIIEREIKLNELRINLVKKNGKRAQLLKHLHNNIIEDSAISKDLNKILKNIEGCTKRADRYRRFQQPLAILTASLIAMGRGPYLPFGVLGQLCSPISGLAAQFCRLQSFRSNPNTSGPDHRSRILKSTWITAAVGSIGVLVASSVAVMKAIDVSAAAPFLLPAVSPFLLPVIATAALISNISNTITSFTNYKNAKKHPSETSPGKKIRMKGHFADVLFNFSNVIASSGVLGITLATVGTLSLAFPPATLATLATVSLGIAIGATVMSTAAYLRKTACWEKANNLKLYTDFEHACKNGLIDALNPSITSKQMRNIVKPNLRSRFFSLFNRDEPLHPPNPQIILRAASDNPQPKETIRHFEQVLHMGYIPQLTSTEDTPMLLPRATPNSEPPKIRLHNLAPPDPLLAVQAIFKQGGIPEIHDEKLQKQVLKAYNKTVPKAKVSNFEEVYQRICDTHVPLVLRVSYTNTCLNEAIALSPDPKRTFTPLNYLHKNSSVEPIANLQDPALHADSTPQPPSSTTRPTHNGS